MPGNDTDKRPAWNHDSKKTRKQMKIIVRTYGIR